MSGGPIDGCVGAGAAVLNFSLVSFWTLLPADVLAAIFVAVLVWAGRREWKFLLIGAVAGGGIGIALTWWFGDVKGLLGIPPTLVDRSWAIAAFAGLGIAIVIVIRKRWVFRILAGLAVICFFVAGGLAINRDGGLFPHVSDVLGVSNMPALKLSALVSHAPGTAFDAQLYRAWVPPTNLPRSGKFGTVAIPGVISHFNARSAIVYLPPAALVPNPPALPVLIVMSGQGPGAAPYNVVNAGHFVTTMNRIAEADHGLAPIVIIPDQLRSPTNNPMCVNGPLGNSATYLTVDLPRWIRAHFRVETGPRAWAIAGFSEGGTCAVQLAAKHPNLFGSFIDVSGQQGPELGSVHATIERGFRGSVTAYRAAQPIRIMQQHGLYTHTNAFISAGQNDSRYGPALPVIAAAAKRDGMHVTTFVVPGASHDWAAAARGLAHGALWLQPRDGLAPPDSTRAH